MIKLDIGIVGLSVMGRSLALNMADHGFKVGGYNRSAAVTEQVMRDHPHENLIPFYDLKDMTDALARPRKVMLMIQAGKPVDAVIEQLVPLLEKGDMILDGGNSFFEDTRRRAALLAEKGIHYLGVGISGGEEGARFGPSVMPGGNADAYESVRPILEAIAARAMDEPCCAYIGPDGAGHYVKMVHNGIEYADMQLIAESYLLLKYVGGFNNQELAHIFKSWNDGELHSYLIGITAGIFREADDLGDGELIDRIKDSAKQKAGDIIEDPTLLDWQTIIDRNSDRKEFVLKNDLDKAVETEQKMYEKEAMELHNSLKGNTITPDTSNNEKTSNIEEMKTDIRAKVNALPPVKKKEMKEKLERAGLPTVFKNVTDAAVLQKVLDMFK